MIIFGIKNGNPSEIISEKDFEITVEVEDIKLQDKRVH